MANWIKYSAFEQKKRLMLIHTVKNKPAVVALSEKCLKKVSRLRLSAFTAVPQIQSWVGEMRFHKPYGAAKEENTPQDSEWSF